MATAGSSPSPRTPAAGRATDATGSACPGSPAASSPASGTETWGYGRRTGRGDPCGDPPLRGAAAYWLDLPRRTRFRLWRTRQVNTAGIWLVCHGRFRAAALLWRIRLR